MAMLLEQIKQAIESAQVIQILRHQDPDPDALGSQFGLKYALTSQYPDKTILVGGQVNELAQELNLCFDQVDEADLTIVLDTPTKERIDGQLLGKTIKLDHHVQVEKFADIELVDTEASASCEIVGAACQFWDWQLSKKAATYLYMGLVADNRHFSTSNTRPLSLLVGAYLLESGVNVVEVEQSLFTKSWSLASYYSHLFSLAQFEDGFVWAIQEKQDYESVGYEKAKNAVHVLGGIQSAVAWALFTRMEDGIHYQASLRSYEYDVRKHAQAYGGGGHVCAAGVKPLTRQQVDQLIEELKKREV